MRRRAVTSLLLLAATAACPRKAPTPPARVPAPADATVDPGFTRACPDLPERRPADFFIRYSVYKYERPEDLARFVLHDAAAPCPPDDMSPHLLGYYRRQLCVPLAAATFDSLYATLRREGLDRIRTRPAEPGPHVAGRLVQLIWGGRECTVGNVHLIMDVAPEQSAAMHRCSEAIAAALRAALGVVDAGTPG